MAKTFAAFSGERLAGRPEQYVDEESLLPNYVIGSRRVVGLTVYHYAKMLATFTIVEASQERGVMNTLALDEQNTSAAPLIAPVGAATLSILDAASAAHDYQNGKICVWPAAAEMQSFDILDNDISDGVNVLLYLARPIRNAIAAGTFTSIYRNPYSAVEAAVDLASQVAPFMGIPQRYITAGYYFWLPTYGLAQIVQGEALDGVGGPGVVFSPIDGAGWKLTTSVTAADSWQRAGHMAAEQTAGIDAGIWLELDP